MNLKRKPQTNKFNMKEVLYNFSGSRGNCLNCPASARIISSFENKFKSNLSSSSLLNCRRREFHDYRNKIVIFGNDFCALFIFQLMQIMIKVSDVSNEARPMEVAEPWLDCLLQEFFIQVKSFL